MWLALLPLSALAHPPVHVELQAPTRLSAMQPVGTQAGSGGGPNPGVVQFVLYWESAEVRGYEAVCFSTAAGVTSTAPHDLAVYAVGANGRPADLLWYSDSIFIASTSISPVLYCAHLDDADGTVVDALSLPSGTLELERGEAVWLAFHRGQGPNNNGYHVLNPTTAMSLGQQHPGGPVVRNLQLPGFSGWASDPPALDVTNGQPVVVSLQVAAPLYVPPSP